MSYNADIGQIGHFWMEIRRRDIPLMGSMEALKPGCHGITRWNFWNQILTENIIPACMETGKITISNSYGFFNSSCRLSNAGCRQRTVPATGVVATDYP